MFAHSDILVSSTHVRLVAGLHAIAQKQCESCDQKSYPDRSRAGIYTAKSVKYLPVFQKNHTPEVEFSISVFRCICRFRQNTGMWEKSTVFAYSVNAELHVGMIYTKWCSFNQFQIHITMNQLYNDVNYSVKNYK